MFSGKLKPFRNEIDEIVWKIIFVSKFESPKVNLKTNGRVIQGIVYGFKGGKQMKKSNAFYVL